MNERKQSFLERLTGTQVVENDNIGVVSLHPRQRVAQVHDTGVEEEEYEEVDEGAVEEEIEAGLAIDMYETDNELVIQSMIAGVTTENLQITITRDMVTIKGKRIPPNGIPEESYVERELYWGVFSREIELPFEIDTDGAEAVEKFGLLIIRLPKLDINRMQELKVKSI
jgi:HSP20 family molecular chaperone IbpA